MTRRSLAWLICVVAALWGQSALPGTSAPTAGGVAPPYGWTSEPMTLDIESGVRTAASEEWLAYDAAWVAATTNGVTFKVSVNGAEKMRVGAYGALDWHEKRPGTYAVTAQAYQGGVLVGELLSASFAMAGHDLVNAEVTVDAANVIYDGSAKRPAVVVRLGGATLTEGVDYDLSYENNVAAGVGKVVITGKGKYVDEIERPFTIRPACCCPLDIESGVRQSAGTETLAVDPTWLGATDSVVRVTANGSFVGEAATAGALAWSPIAPGTYSLVYSTYAGGTLLSETYAAIFQVAGEGVPFEIALDAEVYPYQGAAVVPKVSVSYRGVPLTEGVDYAVALYDNDAVGVARLVITGKGAYSGTVERSFRILASATCELDINDGIRIATGEETIRYSNIWSGTADSTARVTVKDVTVVEEQGTGDWVWTPGGVGLYTFKHTTFTGGLAGEELSAQFYVPGEMTDATVSLAFTECLYDGTAARPKVVVTQGGKTLVEGLDYTVSYALNDRPGTAVVTVRGARGETYEATFTIRPACRCALDIQSGVREASTNEALAYDMSWDGATSAKIAVNGADLATVTGVGASAWQPTAVGDYTVTYRSYNGNAKTDTELSARFHITGQDLVNATITLDNEHILYDGTPREPKVTIVYGGKTLIEGVDYALSYANNVESGVATMTITGKGDYHDVLERSFTIIPAGVCFLDIESGAREAKRVEPLTYDWVWHGGTAANTEMKILVQKSGAAYATTLVSGLKGVGVHDWEPDDKGQVTVTLRTYVDGYYLDTLDETAVFNVAERIPLAVTRFTAAPRYPWNGKVDIDLTFTGENREYAVTLVAKDLVGGTNLVVRTVEVGRANTPGSPQSQQNAISLVDDYGAAGVRALPGTYRLIWDADADIAGDADFERVSIAVRVEEK